MSDSVDGGGSFSPDDVAPAPEPVTKRPRTRALALWGVLAVLALGAGALVVTSGDDDPPQLPVALGAAGAGGDRSESLASPAAADMSMMAWVRYVAGDDLPELGDDGPAYKISGAVDEGRVRDLADALGIDGDVTRREGAWVVSGEGGHLEVYEGFGASWWYSPEDPSVGVGGGVAGSSGSAGITEEEAKRLDELAAREAEADVATTVPADTPVASCPPDALCDLPTPEPITPPADLPSKAEAREIALDLFRAAGLDVDDAKVTVDGPYEAWYVNIEPRIDGRTVSGLGWNASIGSKGKVVGAGGMLNQPERLGDYPVLDTRAAIDRLNEQSGVYEAFAAEDVIASEEPTTSLAPPTTCADDSGIVPCGVPVPADDPACTAAATDVPTTKPADGPDASVSSDDVVEPVPVCMPPVPSEPQEIVLHDAEEILVMVGAFDDSGDAYLVPGYRMTGDDGAVVEVASVDDDSLLPQPEPVEPQTGGTDPGTTRCAAVEPGPDGAVPEICLDPNSVPPAEPQVDPAPG